MFCQEALQLIVGNNLVWSTSRDTHEGNQGVSLFHLFYMMFMENLLAIQRLHVTFFPCLCIIAHQGSQQTMQLQLDRYTGKRERLGPFNLIFFVSI